MDKLLKDNLINKSELINKRHKYLGLDAVQAAFLAKIFINNNEENNKLNLESVSQKMSLDDESTKKVLAPLITCGLLSVESIDGNEFFNFENLIKRLLETYLPPKNSSTLSEKLEWIKDETHIDIENIEIKNIVNNIDWSTIVEVVKALSEKNEVSVPLFVSMINSIVKDNTKQNETIKSILDINWLEK